MTVGDAVMPPSRDAEALIIRMLLAYDDDDKALFVKVFNEALQDMETLFTLTFGLVGTVRGCSRAPDWRDELTERLAELHGAAELLARWRE
ncbi:hypothetical protein AWB91_08925 [Mycobacterium paraense]|uniref:Uncharacterized protein n=1 Tax=Mycobacterium paraense TaxID=767916 RepID=A0ABX3VSU6_9MYCO|nr:hypothetical protein [Mycobacterium paraense]ORW33239.1 hypothetical protein AWB91_08925 [Mycobacterium paraense]ORW38428.1 hypothetical protein AWB88_17790 [Mycobacterium paraense]